MSIDAPNRGKYCEIMSATKEFTVRLPEATYDRAYRLAADRHVDVDRLIEEGLQLIDASAFDQELFDDFSKLGEAGEDMTSVELAFGAQAEVVINS